MKNNRGKKRKETDINSSLTKCRLSWKTKKLIRDHCTKELWRPYVSPAAFCIQPQHVLYILLIPPYTVKRKKWDDIEYKQGWQTGKTEKDKKIQPQKANQHWTRQRKKKEKKNCLKREQEKQRQVIVEIELWPGTGFLQNVKHHYHYTHQLFF